MTVYDLGQVVGSDGATITDISKTGTSGLVDTYTITLSNGDEYTFTVTNGADGGTAITQSVTSGDTTHSPSGDAVYDYIDTIIGSVIDDMES